LGGPDPPSWPAYEKLGSPKVGAPQYPQEETERVDTQKTSPKTKGGFIRAKKPESHGVSWESWKKVGFEPAD